MGERQNDLGRTYVRLTGINISSLEILAGLVWSTSQLWVIMYEKEKKIGLLGRRSILLGGT